MNIKIIRYAAVILMLITMNLARAESIEQFNHDYYTQICKGIIACSDDVGIAENLQLTKIYDIESCVGLFSKMDNPQKWRDAITQKTAEFQPTTSQTCLASIEQLSCKELDRRFAKPSQIKGCEDVIVGTIADSAQCSSHLACESNDASCYGTCEQPRLLQCGDALCSGSEYCDTEKNSCYSLKKNGEACSNFSECEDGCIDGTCKAPSPVLKPGAQCGNNYGNICSIGEFCADDHCTPYRKKGQSCSTDYKQFEECAALLDCQDNKCM